jgi:hypothetical protein
VKQLVKKIMYAEGDLLTLSDECAVYLKDALQTLARDFQTDIAPVEPEEEEKERKRDTKGHAKE